MMAAGFALAGSAASASSLTTYSFAGANMPAGKIVLCIAFWRATGSADRSVSSLSHPALSGAQLVAVGATSAKASYDDGSAPRVWIEMWEATSDGTAGDLSVTLTAGAYGMSVVWFSGDQVGDAIAIGTEGTVNGGNPVTCSLTSGTAGHAVAHAFGTPGNSAPTVTISPAADASATTAPANYRRGGAAAWNNSTGESASFSVSAGTWDSALAQEVLFAKAPAKKGGMMMAA